MTRWGLWKALLGETDWKLLQECTDIGPHYAITLRAWREAWEREHEAIVRLGYSERYWRKFRCCAQHTSPLYAAVFYSYNGSNHMLGACLKEKLLAMPV